jgi:hypothetical protein
VQHVGQFNIARGRAPLDDPEMSGFVARLAEINALADASPGFVWRLQDDTGDPPITSVSICDICG